MPQVIAAVISYAVQAATASALGAIGSGIAGAVAGGLVASALQPKQKSEGPRLGDLRVQSSSYGTVIPFALGTPRFAGQIVWASSKRESKTVTSSGKGGGQESTSYTYAVDLLIVLTNNVQTAVTRVWANGGLIWNKLSTGTDATIIASDTIPQWTRLTFYTGSSTQLPDPTYEAAVGTANAPAYRGRSSVFIEGLQLGSSGQIPNLTFEIATTSTSSPGPRIPWVSDSNTLLLLHGDGADGSTTIVDSSSNASVITISGGIVLDTDVAPAVGSASILHPANQGGNFYTAQLGSIASTLGDFCIEFWARNTANYMLFYFAGGAYLYNNSFQDYGGSPVGISTYFSQFNWHHYRINREGSVITTLLDGVPVSSQTYAGTINASTIYFAKYVPNGNLFFEGWMDEIRVSNCSRGSVAFTPNPAGPASVTTFSETLSSVVSALCLRAGMTASQINVTALSAVTTKVRGLVISQISSIRSVLDTIRNCYFVDCVASDKLYFFVMGGASVATIPYSDLGADGGKPFIITDSSELEVYAQLSLAYSNSDNDHQADVQLSDRLLSGQQSTSVASVPFDFTATEAKIIVDTQLLLQAIGMRRASVTVGRKYYYVQAGDPITIVGADGSTYRFRVIQISVTGGIYKLDIVIDDASCYLQNGITSAVGNGQTTVTPIANTVLKLLDTPLLTESNNLPGFYAAVKGGGGTWRAAVVYSSIDGVTYSVKATYADEAIIGTATTTLGTWTGGNVLDITNTLTVNIGTTGSFSSTTLAAILQSLSLNLVMVGGELIQFVTATLSGTGVYVLSGLLRGRRGTEWAIGTHVSSETVVALGTAGLRFIQIQTGEIGRLQYLKPVTSGQALTAATAQTFTPTAIALKPFAPINLRANRASVNTILSWERRTRFSYRITGTLAWSCPLGETSESYVIEIYSSVAYTTLKRTLTSATSSVTYTSAQQVTDFGSNQTIVYAKVYQVSAAVGNGYPLTASS